MESNHTQAWGRPERRVDGSVARSGGFTPTTSVPVRVTADAVRIRPAAREDVPQLATLYHRSYGGLEELGFPSSMTSSTEDRFLEWLGSREMFVAVIGDTAGTDGDTDSDGETVVGCVHLKQHDDWPCPELGRLAVDPNHQESGVGTQLREYVEETARDRGHDRIRLRTFTGHPFLREWYERAGYEKVGDQELDTPHYDLHVLEKEL